MKINTSRSGFTLIEFSIVMVIIGLVLSGIVIGREIIRAAEIRKIVSTAQQAKSAINTFKLKYGQLPGDFEDAAELWPESNAVNGDGDGRFEKYNVTEAIASYDAYNVFHHLSMAKLVEGAYIPEAGPGGLATCQACSQLVGIEDIYKHYKWYEFFYNDSRELAACKPRHTSSTGG